jgi:hypothetical protein
VKIRALAIFALLVALARSADAQSTSRIDAVVRVTSADDRVLFTRILGQVADLDATVTEDERPLEQSFTDQLNGADDLATLHHARVVVWVLPRTRAEGLLLCISEPRAGRVLVRAVGEGLAPNNSTSAVLEQSALVVRNALRALAAGGTIGVERKTYDEPRAQAPPPTHPSTRPPQRFVGVAGIGGDVGVDGTVGRGGLATWLGGRGGIFEFRLDASFGVPTDTTSLFATLHVTRDTFALASAATIVRSQWWDLDVGGRAGAALYLRMTRDPRSLVTPAALGIAGAGVVGLELRGRFRPTRGVWAIVLAAGLDVLLGAPTFGLTESSGFVPLFTPTTLEPRALLGIELTTMRGVDPIR